MFERPGVIREYVGGYADWLHQQSTEFKPVTSSKKAGINAEKSKAEKNYKAVKLSYKDQRELDELPELIEKLESHIAELENTMGQADFYSGKVDSEAVIRDATRVSRELETAYHRWGELDALSTKTV